jgi:hypothetical protein
MTVFGWKPSKSLTISFLILQLPSINQRFQNGVFSLAKSAVKNKESCNWRKIDFLMDT